MNKFTYLGWIFLFVIAALLGCSDEPKEQVIDYTSPKSIITSMITGLQDGKEEIPTEVFADPEKAMSIFNFTGNRNRESELDMMMFARGEFDGFSPDNLTETVAGDKATVKYGIRIIHFENIDGVWKIVFP